MNNVPSKKLNDIINKASIIENRLARLHTFVTSAEDDLFEDTGNIAFVDIEDTGNIASVDINAFRQRSKASKNATKALKKTLNNAKNETEVTNATRKALTAFQTCINEIDKEAKRQNQKPLHKNCKSVMNTLQQLIDKTFPKKLVKTAPTNVNTKKEDKENEETSMAQRHLDFINGKRSVTGIENKDSKRIPSKTFEPPKRRKSRDKFTYPSGKPSGLDI